MGFEIPFDRPPHKHDDALVALPPSKCSEYSFDRLSAIATIVLLAALADGFHDMGATMQIPMPAPSNVDSGLLKHSFSHLYRTSGGFTLTSESQIVPAP